jgi:hypothetical protein
MISGAERNQKAFFDAIAKRELSMIASLFLCFLHAFAVIWKMKAVVRGSSLIARNFLSDEFYNLTQLTVSIT